MVYCVGKLIENWNIFRFTWSHFIKAIDHTFYGFTGVITHAGRWENTRKACKSLAEDRNSVTCHAWFFEKLHRKLKVNVVYESIHHSNDVEKCSKFKWNHEPQLSGFTAKFWTFYGVISLVYKSVECGKLWSIFFYNNIYFWFPAKFRHFHLRRVIYKLFSCSPNIPRGLSRR